MEFDHFVTQGTGVDGPGVERKGAGSDGQRIWRAEAGGNDGEYDDTGRFKQKQGGSKICTCFGWKCC